MGIYLNPGSRQFEEALNSQIYVDKTAMVADVNALVNTSRKYLCISRPRRFGKTMTASMLCAYYGQGEDRHAIFEHRMLAGCPDWDRYLGKFNVLRLTMTQFLRRGVPFAESLQRMQTRLGGDLRKEFPKLAFFDDNDIISSLQDIYASQGIPFVIIIDEWDAIFREYPNDHQAQKDYLDFLRNFLKDQDYVALAYMTGILPIKKYGKHSALNMFSEYSMTSQMQFAPYTGFTEEEVQLLCANFGMDFNSIKEWYNGYKLFGTGIIDQSHRATATPTNAANATVYCIYSPLSVVEAIMNKQITNYWNKTETYEALAEYIRMDFDGLKETVAKLMQGDKIKISLGTYTNDMTSLTCRDDVMALLIHLGYLGYDQSSGEVFIPNREILDEYRNSTRTREWSSTFRALKNSRQLVAATEAGDADAIAELVEAAHDSAGNRTYNSEAALSYAIQLAYYAAQDDYTLFPEVDTGKGYADLLYVPKLPGKPAMLIELKYNQNANTALEQILRQKYPARLEKYKGNLILVGINYSHSASPTTPDFKHHSCKVMRA